MILSPPCLAVSHRISHIFIYFMTLYPACIFLFSPSQHQFIYFMTLFQARLAVPYHLRIHVYTLCHCLQPVFLFLTASAFLFFMTLSPPCLAVSHHLNILSVLYDTVFGMPYCFSPSQHACLYLYPHCLAISHRLSMHVCIL